MVAPAFGFSVGDFLAAGGLIVKICKALREAGGAASEYQQVIIELEGLQRCLNHLQTLDPDEYNTARVNALRSMALSVRIPLEKFLKKLQQYEQSMGPFAPRARLHGASKKAKWAVTVTEEVNRFRAIIVAKTVSINLLIGIHNSEGITGVARTQKEQDKHLKARLSDFRQSVIDAEAKREVEDEKSAQFRLDTQSALDGIRRDAKSFSSDTSNQLDQISANTSSMQMSLVSINDLGRQIVAFLSSFPVEMRDLLRKVHSVNLQMYCILLQQSRTVPSSPQLQHEKIDLLDCMGRQFELPYEWFCRWEVLQGLLRTELRNVTDEEYELYNTSDNCQLVRKEDWSLVRPGSKIYMAMVIPQLQWEIGTCPRPSCRRAIDTESGNLRACPHCGLRFLFDYAGDTLDEGSRVSELQGEEDLELFGARETPDQEAPEEAPVDDIENASFESSESPENKPFDMIEPDKPSTSTYHPKKGSFANLGSIIKSKFVPKFHHNIPGKTAKTTLLSSWLASVERPNVSPNPTYSTPTTRNETQKVEDLKIVSIKARPVPKSEVPRAHTCTQNGVEGSEDMPFAARIYYRNILDRFPRLPRALARRFAEADLRRARILQIARGEAEETDLEIAPLDPDDKHSNPPSPASSPSALSVPRAGSSETVSEEVIRTWDPREPLESLLEFSFWTGMPTQPGPHSSASGSSSRNSSLQSAESPVPESASSSAGSSIERPLPNMVLLPPPPVELGGKGSFACDICGATIHILRRKEWRRHVLHDLQPYVCSFEDCKTAGKLYSTRKAWFTHEKKRHRALTEYHCPAKCKAKFGSVSTLGNHLRKVHGFRKWEIRDLDMRTVKKTTTTHLSYCTFCDTHLADDISVPQHVGRHLEELAFIILSKQYQEWEFYDENSTAAHALSCNSSEYSRRIRDALVDGELGPLVQLQSQGYDPIPSGETIMRTWDRACSGSYPERNVRGIVWYLLRNGARPPSTFIEWAIRSGHMDMVTLLLKADPLIGPRFMFFAISGGAWEIVEMFHRACEDAGCPVYIEDVFDVAFRHSAPGVAERLLNVLTSRSADLIEECADSWYRMHRERNYPLVNRFLELTESPLPLHLTRALDIIVDRPACPKDRSSEYQIFTPPNPGSNEDLIARALTTHASRIATQKINDTTVLCLAASDSHLGVIHYLLHMGCDPNEPDERGRFPLHEAITSCRFEAARLLVASGARIDIGRGQVVFDYASFCADIIWTWEQQVDKFREFMGGSQGSIEEYSHRSLCSSCS